MNNTTNNTNFKRPFYLRTEVILFFGSLWLLYAVPLIVAIILLILQKRYDKKYMSELKEKITDEVKSENIDLIKNAENEVQSIKNRSENELKHIVETRQSMIVKKDEVQGILDVLEEKVNKLIKQESNLKIKISKLKPVSKAVNDSIEYYRIHGEFSELTSDILELLHPTVELPLHTEDVKVLKQKSNNIKKHIDKLLEQYEARYTTKANKSIYSLMVIALQAELQNILYNLKFDKIENTRTQINEIALKYIDIAGKGNQNIYSTIVKFIGELESLFLQLTNIEYEYYTKREKEKEEQKLIREQMAQEAGERKLLKEQQQKIEKEEQKYHQEISNLQSVMDNETDSNKLAELEKKINELTNQLNKVEEKKEEIINLQNGKAGNVYVISNIGSFGENIFKVGMTRRLEPTERIKELSSASVPFSFDVHSFIFSDNAPALEKKIHDALHDNRVNKVNFRKEFFKIDINKIEALVNELDPTAEFKKTLIAQEYQQTLEIELTKEIM